MVALPALPTAWDDGQAFDVVIQPTHSAAPADSDWLHDWHGQDDVALSLARHGDDFWLNFPGLADFRLQFSHGRIGVFAFEGADDNTLEHLLVDQVLPRYVAHLDTLVAHASAVAIHGRHALFLGQSGWGKSTLAGLLQRCGHRVLSDDCVQLIEESGHMMALSTYPSLRLLPDSIDEIFPAIDTASPMADYSDKMRVPVAHREDDCSAVTVDALYLLGNPSQAQDAISITPLSPGDACKALIEHSFRLDLNDRKGNASHFARCSAAARAIPAFEIHYPRDYAQNPALVQHVIHHLGSLWPDR